MMRTRRRSLAALAIVAVIVIALGKTLVDTVARPLRQAPPGYATSPPAGEWTELRWGDLHKGKWQQGQKPVIPAAVAEQVGKPVKLKGFILPLHEAAEASEFFLAKSPGGCYFCNPPGISEVVMVCHQGGRKLAATDLPVYVCGTFKAATGSPDDQCLYVIKDAIIGLAQ